MKILALMLFFITIINAVVVAIAAARPDIERYITVDDSDATTAVYFPCARRLEKMRKSYVKGCLPRDCGRFVFDDLFSEQEVSELLKIANKGMSQREDVGGPTILDINTGYIRDSKGLENLFLKENDIYTADDFSHYGKMIHRLREKILEKFSISTLFFTAPTFITRIHATNDWHPLGKPLRFFRIFLYLISNDIGVHDEYWHPHADMNNTPHYQYSGLLYLSTYGKDFTGGRFFFVDSSRSEYFETQFGENITRPLRQHSPAIPLGLEPKAGRVLLFTSGMENTHFVEQVTSGKRYVLSFWFTCDQQREFHIFLDGKAHVAFSKNFKEGLLQRKQASSASSSSPSTISNAMPVTSEQRSDNLPAAKSRPPSQSSEL